eukprot:7522855-Prorocentrum_lima.AAC.1
MVVSPLSPPFSVRSSWVMMLALPPSCSSGWACSHAIIGVTASIIGKCSLVAWGVDLPNGRRAACTGSIAMFAARGRRGTPTSFGRGLAQYAT